MPAYRDRTLYGQCRAPITGAGARGEVVRWDEEAVAAFLTVYFHGVGAPRLELGDGKSALGAPKRDGVRRVKYFDHRKGRKKGKEILGSTARHVMQNSDSTVRDREMRFEMFFEDSEIV